MIERNLVQNKILGNHTSAKLLYGVRKPLTQWPPLPLKVSSLLSLEKRLWDTIGQGEKGTEIIFSENVPIQELIGSCNWHFFVCVFFFVDMLTISKLTLLHG